MTTTTEPLEASRCSRIRAIYASCTRSRSAKRPRSGPRSGPASISPTPSESSRRLRSPVWSSAARARADPSTCRGTAISSSRFTSRSRELAYAAVMTIMVRLHEKELLERTREGKTYLYRPALTRQELRERLSRDLARGLVADFGDAALAAFTAELGTVDASHRAALRRVAQKDNRGPR